MALIRIDERLPDAPLASEVVLHLRRHLRRALRTRAPTAPHDLAHIFGFAREEGSCDDWSAAADDSDPLQAGAAVAARRQRRGAMVVSFGHDQPHVLECKHWLGARAKEDDAFASIKASDVATLLELSKARDVACARGRDARGRERFLPVLIQGGTGTGKELLAEGIHRLWSRTLRRTDAPFEVVQVAGMSPDLVSDELFGHARGAFTSANRDRPGRIEAANGGTLLIDEVGDLPPEAQMRLLRFLQTQAVSRVGENKERQLSVRILAATWHDIDADVAAGKFREDLLHRLRVGSGLHLPPLSAREDFFDDVLPELLRDRHHAAQPLLTRSARDALAHQTWPGNLRELVGVLDEVVSIAAGETIRLEHLPSHMQRKYLALPLHDRALGFLLEEVDGQGLPAEHVAWRIKEINGSFAAVSPPPQNEPLATVGHFLSLIDDNSDHHRRTVAEMQRLLELDQAQRQAAIVSAFWGQVLALRPPPSVADLVKRAAKEATTARRATEREIENVRKSATIDSSPWLRLFREVHALPLLREANAGDLANAFLAVFNIVKLVAPSVIGQLRADAKAGGFAKIRERIVAALKDPDIEKGPDRVDAGQRSQPPAKLSRSDWTQLATDFLTQRAAVDATGYDPKTFAKYFGQHRIRNPWKAKTPRKRG